MFLVRGVIVIVLRRKKPYAVDKTVYTYLVLFHLVLLVVTANSRKH